MQFSSHQDHPSVGNAQSRPGALLAPPTCDSHPNHASPAVSIAAQCACKNNRVPSLRSSKVAFSNSTANLCASNPCTARWAASKYGVIGPPIHLQPKTYSEVSFGPKPPVGAPLHAGSIPSPATIDPQLRALASKSAVAGAMAETTNPGHKIFARILALAREIRTPRTYVEYSCWALQGNANHVCGRVKTE